MEGIKYRTSALSFPKVKEGCKINVQNIRLCRKLKQKMFDQNLKHVSTCKGSTFFKIANDGRKHINSAVLLKSYNVGGSTDVDKQSKYTPAIQPDIIESCLESPFTSHANDQMTNSYISASNLGNLLTSLLAKNEPRK